MNQLSIVHKKSTNNNQKQVIENTKRDRRESKGRILTISRRTYRLLNSDVYYVDSESSDDLYYYVKFKPDVFEWCCCPDNSTRHVKCKHLFAIEFAIKWGILKDIGKLSVEARRYGTTAEVKQSKSYEEDEYDL